MQIVSAYYKIPSKKDHAFYMGNITRFFQFLKNQPILFFCEEDTLDELHAIAGPNVEFCIQPFRELDVFEEYPPSFWKRQIELDPEPYHTWQLGAIWANKKYFLERARQVHQEMDWFVWVDAGCVRHNAWSFFTEEFTRRNRFQEPGVYVQLLKPTPPEEQYFRFPAVYIAGAVILAHKDYIQKYIDEYNATLDCYSALEIPATMDQYVMASIQAPWLHKILLPSDQRFPDDWFFFLGYI
jgi:hypothetical protein